MASIGTLLERLYVSIGADLSELNSEMRNASRTAKRSAEEIGQSFSSIGSRLSGAGRSLSLYVTAPLAAVGTASVRAASDAAELQSAFDATFGEMAASMNEWARATGDAMGRSTQEIQEGANAFGLYFNQAARTREEAARMSQQFTVLAQDLASFHNTSVDEALTALRSGLSGETEPLRRYGVFLNEAAVQAKALEMGLVPVNGRLTDQQKIMARSAIIMEATATAQGDVIRTGGSTANQLRAMSAAWEELTVSIGQVLLPIITPVISKIAELINKFGELDPELQKTIVYFGLAAAAIGPMLVAIGSVVSAVGSIVTAMAPFINVVRTIAATQGIWTAITAGATGLGAAFGPILAIAAAVAAVGYVIYENWDKIAPVLENLRDKFEEVIGPKVQAFIDDISAKLTELWNGPLGDGIREVVDILGTLLAAFMEVYGEYMIRVIGAFIEFLRGAFDTIINIIRLVVAVLSGDWEGAWQAAKDFVADIVRAVIGIVESLVPGFTEAMARLYNGVKTWLQDRLGAVFNWVTDKLRSVGDAFYDLYDRVVGNSYVPDMIDGIAEQMRRLDSVMVDPARRAARSTADAMRTMASDVQGLLRELFPVSAQINQIREDMELLDRALAAGPANGGIDQATYDAARDELRRRREDIRRQNQPDLPISILSEGSQPVIDLTRALEGLNDIVVDLPEVLTVAQQEIFEFGQGLGNDIMGGIRDVLTGRRSLKDALKDLFSNFLYNVVTDALKNLETGIFGEGGLGGFLGGVLSSLIGGGSRAVGGPTLPGRAYDVGFGEKFVPGQHGRILSRSDAMRAVAGDGGGFAGTIRINVNGARGNAEIRDMVSQGVQEGLATYDQVVGSRVKTNLKRRG